MNPQKWTFRAIATATALVVFAAAAPRASAQPRDNNVNPFRLPPGGFVPPGGLVQPVAPVQPIAPIQPVLPVIAPQFGINPVGFAAVNPFAVNPFVNNPFANPFGPQAVIAGPFQINPLNNPFNNPLNNPLGLPPGPNFNFAQNPLASPFANPFFRPTFAFQQPGRLFWRGPDLLVNPWSGTVVRPFTGVAQTADGTIFFQLSRNGLPTVFDQFGGRTNIYVNPSQGTLFNPVTGVIVQPGTASTFVPRLP